MRFSRRVQYALYGIFDLAYNGGGEPVRVRAIGDRQRIPHRFLEQIFQRLRKANLVEGKRGPGGGYVLARPPEAIRLRDVVEAIEGSIDGGLGLDDPSAAGDGPGDHRPSFVWGEIAGRIAGALEDLTIADVCREAMRRGVERDLPTGFDFQI